MNKERNNVKGSNRRADRATPETSKNRYKGARDGKQDTCYGRQASFVRIRCGKERKLPELPREELGDDSQFWNTPAKKAFMTFQKYEIEKNGDCSALSVARFDALMTTAKDALIRILKSARKWVPSLSSGDTLKKDTAKSWRYSSNRFSHALRENVSQCRSFVSTRYNANLLKGTHW